MAKDDDLKQLQADIKKILDEQNADENLYNRKMSNSQEAVSEEAVQPETEPVPDEMLQPETESVPDEMPQPKTESVPDEMLQPEMESVSDEISASEPDELVTTPDSEVIGGFRVMEIGPDDADSPEEPEDLPESDETAESDESNGKKKGSIWNRLLFIAGILMIAYAAYSIGSLYWNYHQSNSEYDDITQEFVTVNTDNSDADGSGDDFDGLVTSNSEDDTSSYPWYDEISVDIAGLQAKYSDVAGWLYQEGGTAISYPIMYNEDDVYYLHKTYKGTYAYAGSIFMETLNNRDFNDSNTIIYGHNMRNGSMFGTLKYLRNDGYIDEHGYFQIFLEDEIRRYQVFAYEVVTSDSWVYQVPFGETEAFTEYINRAISNSEVDTGVEVTNQDHIIVLSTCYGTNTNKRFVVFAVWMDTYYYDTGLTQSEIDAAAGEDGTESTEDTETSANETGTEAE